MNANSVLSRSQLWGRRCRAVVLTLVCGLAVSLFLRIWEQNLVRTSFFTGYLLTILLGFLSAFSLRKRLSFSPWLGTASQWLQAHVYVALFSGWLFLEHIHWRFPQGWLEVTLAAAFAATFVSGVVGWWMSRVYPGRLANLRTQVIYERIPASRFQLWGRAQQLMVSQYESNDTLQRLWINRVAGFLALPRQWAFILAPSNRECRRLVDDLLAADRYLSEAERLRSRELMQMVREKDDLDYHWVLQSRLKYWLFLHLGLTVALVILGVIHGVMAQAFHGGGR